MTPAGWKMLSGVLGAILLGVFGFFMSHTYDNHKLNQNQQILIEGILDDAAEERDVDRDHETRLRALEAWMNREQGRRE